MMKNKEKWGGTKTMWQEDSKTELEEDNELCTEEANDRVSIKKGWIRK